MDKKKLREIIAVFKESGLAKMEISESNSDGNFAIKLENASASAPAPIQYVSLPEPKQEEAQASSEIKDFNKYRDVKSPMVGIFYAASSPDAEPFVKVGSKVTPNTVVCILEAMKLFSEIEAEVEGEITEVLVNDGEFVEFGQPLFKVKTV